MILIGQIKVILIHLSIYDLSAGVYDLEISDLNDVIYLQVLN